MDCNSCKEKHKQTEPIPFIAYESGMARMERTNKRLWIAVIVLILSLVGTNLAWTIYESQFETIVVTQEVEQDADDGINHFIGGDYYGETEGDYYN